MFVSNGRSRFRFGRIRPDRILRYRSRRPRPAVSGARLVHENGALPPDVPEDRAPLPPAPLPLLMRWATGRILRRSPTAAPRSAQGPKENGSGADRDYVCSMDGAPAAPASPGCAARCRSLRRWCERGRTD
ncbi:hypothetical protein GCM10027440_54960 [Nocardiopsis coralliicola]